MLGENLLGNNGLFVIYSLKNQANLKKIFGSDKMEACIAQIKIVTLLQEKLFNFTIASFIRISNLSI